MAVRSEHNRVRTSPFDTTFNGCLKKAKAFYTSRVDGSKTDFYISETLGGNFIAERPEIESSRFKDPENARYFTWDNKRWIEK